MVVVVVLFLLNLKIKGSVFGLQCMYMLKPVAQMACSLNIQGVSYSCRLFSLLPKRLLDLNLSMSFKQRVFVHYGYIADVMKSIKELMM